ncbi:RTA1-domain-containing protein [Westerdykella ornata]|uniref:RTA1-domain-containing protein n=1 Tax=Westerdykella ornata TaxID=318751 RepID=A0A6A6JPI9_WESOR|nr:RTA1-domain-containing protein [Westerdykella ornata]KAF2278442.1 RTA1-domain-containing protein [Westerdykella ornata]
MADEYHPSLDNPNAWVPYRYHPSKTAAIIFVVAFSLTTVLHVLQVFRRKTWYFIPLVVGGIFEIVGFIGRILSANNIWALGPFIMQSLLLLLAPALFAASVYIILGRIILLTNGEKYSLIRQKWLTKVFVTGDVMSFLTQCGGGGIQAVGSLGLMHAGEKIIIVGLFLQLTFFGFFILVAGIFHHRLSRANSASSSNTSRHPMNRRGSTGYHDVDASDSNAHDLPWRRHMYALYTASALIMIRSVFRVIEYLQGNNGYLLRREVFLYVFDALLMLVVMVLFNWIHPAEVTDLYQKQISGQPLCDLEETRQRYLGTGEE